MQKSGDIGDFCVGEIESGHAFVRSSLTDDGADLIAVVVVADHDTQDEIRTIRSASGIGAMAEGTRSEELIVATLNDVGRVAGPLRVTPPRCLRGNGSVLST